MRRLDSHALLSVVILSFVVSIMLSAAIALAYTRSTELVIYRNYIKGYRNIQSAQEYFFSLQSETPQNINIDLFQTGDDSVQIRSCHWGLWEAAGFKSSVMRNKSIERSMIYGCVPTDKFNAALWMPMVSYGVGLTGNAIIKGDCYIAEGGVRSNLSVSGYSSTVAQHLIGNTYKCDPANLEPTQQQVLYLSSLLKGNFSALFSATEMYVSQQSDSIYRSFSAPTLCIMLDKERLNLSNIHITGNCILYSSNPISIPAAATLQQVQVIAPSVIVESGFKGSIHILATDSIIVNGGAALQYPSSVVLVIPTFKTNNCTIRIQQLSQVNGIVYLYQGVPDMQRSIIHIAENAITKGLIYTNSLVELKGKHIGNITTAGFYFKNNEQILNNVLPTGTIDFTTLSKHFVIPNLTTKKTRRQTACWIEE